MSRQMPDSVRRGISRRTARRRRTDTASNAVTGPCQSLLPMLAHVFRLVPLLRPLVSNGHGNGNDEAGGKETAEAKATATARVKPGGAIRLVTAGARRSFDCARGARCAQDDGGWVVRTAGTRFDAVFVSGIWARSESRGEPLRWVLRPCGPAGGADFSSSMSRQISRVGCSPRQGGTSTQPGPSGPD